MTLSKSASVVSRIPVRVSMPALLTMTSSRPNVWTAVPTRRSRSATLADVGVDADRAVAERDDLALKLELGVGVGDVVDDHVGAGLGQREDDRLADPAVAAGDDGGCAVEAHCMLP